MVKAPNRVAEIIGSGLSRVQLDASVTPRRLAELARYGMGPDAAHLRRHGDQRRLATLVATVTQLEATATDDALELLELLMATVWNREGSTFQGNAVVVELAVVVVAGDTIGNDEIVSRGGGRGSASGSLRADARSHPVLIAHGVRCLRSVPGQVPGARPRAAASTLLTAITNH